MGDERMKHTLRELLLRLLFASCLSGYFISTQAAEDTYEEDTILKEADAFFGGGAEGLAEVIEKIFKEKGKPNAFIKGQEASGAIVIGARYGDGTLVRKAGGSRKVHWTGPSIGFDAGGNLSKVFVLIYNLPNMEAIFQRFPAIDGSFYFIGGVGANYHQIDNIVLAPMRFGAGFRAGVNIGYMHYRKKKSWNPF
ncbi:MAG: hypothetical protein ACI9ZT_000462 [Gammaproteobacteria bacterium]|jgi:hypothetical protein